MNQPLYSLTGMLLGMSLLAVTPLMAQERTAATAQDYYLFIGTYAPKDSNGIFVYRFNPLTGQSTLMSTLQGIENPSFLTYSQDHRFVYAVSETHGGQGGAVYAYAFDPSNGKLRYINHQLSGGDDPCNIIMDQTGKWLFVSNYNGGNVSVFPVEESGALGKAIQTIQHHGHGINPERQTKPHVHCVLPAPNNRDIFVTDLGLDRVFTYELNPATGQLSAGNPPFTTVTPGTGPRHLAFSPNGKYLYLLHEIKGTLTAFAYSPGKLTQIQTLSNVPDDFQGKIWAADIHLSPDGRFLYASNRDDLNDLVTYAVEQASGKLTLVSRTSSGGKTPRNFAISPDGNFLVVANRNSPEATVFKRDQQTGRLTETPHRIRVSQAVCIKMMPVQ